MTDLRQTFLSLEPGAKRRVHMLLCENALSQWQSFAIERRRIRYVDSVVGGRHEVELELPSEALRSVANAREDVADVEQRYAEPITAIHDHDLKFPDHIEFAYYSIYNLFRKYALGKEVDDWLVVNQAIAAEPDQSSWASLLEIAIKKSTDQGAAPNGGPATRLGNSGVAEGPPSVT